jgi:cell division protease FtsH
MGGRIAEEMHIGRITTGAGNDIERATALARKMVCEWGMSEKLGPLTFGKKEEQIFLGREIAQHRDYSEETAIEIDREVKTVVMEAYEVSKRILEENRDALIRIAGALLDREVLDAHEIAALVKGEPLPDRPPEPVSAAPAEEPAPGAEPEKQSAGERPSVLPQPGKSPA